MSLSVTVLIMMIVCVAIGFYFGYCIGWIECIRKIGKGGE
jgi:hypothetical protein